MRDQTERKTSFSSASPSNYINEEGPSHGTSDELLDYVAYLENELDSVKLQSNASQSKHQEEKSRLKERLEAALDKMDEAERELQAQKESGAQTQTAVERLKDEFNKTERLLQEERRKEKNLEDRIQKLELELEMKNDLINHRRRRDERARKQLEKENEILKKKATLGWMLGCLSEVYLQSEPEGAAAPLLKMVRNIQRELERENVVLSYSNEPPQIQLEYVEKEIRRLIDCARLTESEAEPSIKGPDQSHVKQSASSPTQRSLEEAGASFKAKMGSESDDQDVKSLTKVVACKARGYSPNPPRTTLEAQEDGSPSARYIINCFGGDAATSDAEIANGAGNDDDAGGVEVEVEAGRNYYNKSCSSSQAQIEMFEANPQANVEHTRLTGSTWAEVKVMNRRGAERAEMLHCQSDIKKMLSSLEASMEYLLQLQQHQHQHQHHEEEQVKKNINNVVDSSNSSAVRPKSRAGKPGAAAAHLHQSKHPPALSPSSRLKSRRQH